MKISNIKATSGFLAAVLCLSLAACGEGSVSASSKTLPSGTIAKKLDSTAVTPLIDRKTIPDLGLFFGRGSSAEEAS